LTGSIETDKAAADERIVKVESVVASVTKAFEVIGKRLGMKTSLEIEKLDNKDDAPTEDVFGKAMRDHSKK